MENNLCQFCGEILEQLLDECQYCGHKIDDELNISTDQKVDGLIE